MKSGILRYGEDRISYSVSVVEGRSARIAVHVHPDGSVAVDAPPDRSDEEIARAVQKRARWIADHVAEARARFRHVAGAQRSPSRCRIQSSHLTAHWHPRQVCTISTQSCRVRSPIS